MKPESENILEALRAWWAKHGPDHFADADEWINSLSNVELLEVISWIESID